MLLINYRENLLFNYSRDSRFFLLCIVIIIIITTHTHTHTYIETVVELVIASNRKKFTLLLLVPLARIFKYFQNENTFANRVLIIT